MESAHKKNNGVKQKKNYRKLDLLKISNTKISSSVITKNTFLIDTREEHNKDISSRQSDARKVLKQLKRSAGD